MTLRRYLAVWTIAALCVLGYVLGHGLHWQPLEHAQAAWRHMGNAAAFRAPIFWSFAPVSTLLHTGPIHLAINLWCLFVLGGFVEAGEGSVAVIVLWIVSAYTAMGLEAWLGGVGRIGLSAFTYALLGAALARGREAGRSPRRLWTGGGMLAFLLLGGLERLGLPPLAPEVAHVAHAGGLLTGLLFALALHRSRCAAAV